MFVVLLNNMFMCGCWLVLCVFVDVFGEICNFIVFDGDMVLYVECVEIIELLWFEMWFGMCVLLYCMVSGKLFLL